MKKPEILLYVAFAQAAVATLGSLFFSEVMGFPPCILCWYQRIAMYPLVIILATGILKNDKNVVSYALPFSIIGGLIAIYHNLLYYGIIPESVAPCTLGISCTTQFIMWLGFITIPLLSLAGFALITACLLGYRKMTEKGE